MLELRPGLVSRIRAYLAEMYPVPERLALSILLYVTFVTLLSRIHGVEAHLISLLTLAGIWHIFALLLILRLMDELKDIEVDRELFSERPLPSGKVLESDIKFSLLLVIALFVMANCWDAKVALATLFVLGYALLMFKFFFIPNVLRKYLLLNLASHNPIVPLLFTSVLVMFAAGNKLDLSAVNWRLSLLLIVMYWGMFFAWEISRKIRSREEENEYVTYSQILGRRGAVLAALTAQTVTLAIGCYLYSELSLPKIFIVILAIGYGITVCGHAYFLINPNPRTSKLRRFVEGYIFTVLIAQTLGYWLSA